MAIDTTPIDPNAPIKKKSLSWSNLIVGAALNLVEVSTLGQPLEVIKTHLAANRNDNIVTAVKKTWRRGGTAGFFQGLVPWAWIEASTKGGILLFTASEIEYKARLAGASPFLAGIAGGMGGGIVQAYTTMGFCTFMKTVEVTRHKSGTPASTWTVAQNIIAREGIAGINKGVNAVALRQCTNWASRFGFTRLAETMVLQARYGKDVEPSKIKKRASDKVLASIIGGTLACWNQPIEVIRVEMQSQLKTPGRPEKMTILRAARWIYVNNGTRGFFRGITPRLGLGIWQTVFMVACGDYCKEFIARRQFIVAHHG